MAAVQHYEKAYAEAKSKGFVPKHSYCVHHIIRSVYSHILLI